MKLYGKNPVLERLKANPKSIKKIFIEEGQPDAAYIRKKASQWSIPVVSVPRSKMIKVGRDIRTQGLLIEIDDFQYQDYEELLQRALKKKTTLVFLDNLNDPQNLGVIIRSLACLGDFAIVLPAHNSVEVTEAVLRVASGADNYIPIAKVNNLSQAILSAKKCGFWIAATVVEEGQDLTQVAFPFPLGIVIGSEHKGVRDVVKKQMDIALTIPTKVSHISLNAAQAATIFCYEIAKQKNQKYQKYQKEAPA